MTLRALLMLAFLASVSGAAAQTQAPHVCGAGPGPNEMQAGVQPGGPGIAPTPLCYWKSGQPSQPSGYWEKTWGAVAPSPVGGVLGTAVGARSKEEAERIALEDCKAKGGGACEINLAYHNQCVVMILGDKYFNSYSNATIKEAATRGLNECRKDDNNCEVYYSACTEPIFHKY